MRLIWVDKNECEMKKVWSPRHSTAKLERELKRSVGVASTELVNSSWDVKIRKIWFMVSTRKLFAWYRGVAVK
jgi:hypothetical protein